MTNLGHLGLQNPGDSGAQGATGAQGFQGLQGAQGFQGAIAAVAAAVYGEMSTTAFSAAITQNVYLPITSMSAGDLSNVTLVSDQLKIGVAGPLRLSAAITYTPAGANNVIRAAIHKNGSILSESISEAKNSVATNFIVLVSQCLDVASVNDVYDIRVTCTSASATITINFVEMNLNMVSGTQGVQGAQGFQGNVGIQGPQGNQGNQGALGPQGNQGNVGVQGFQGFQGTNPGAQGPQGPQPSPQYVGIYGCNGITDDGGTTAEIMYSFNPQPSTVPAWNDIGYTRVPVPVNGFANNLVGNVRVNTLDGNAVISVCKNGVPTSLKFTVTPGSTGAMTGAGGPVAFLANDLISFHYDTSASSSGKIFQFTLGCSYNV